MSLNRLSHRARTEASGGGAGKWAEILALAKPGVINLGQGFPDFSGHSKAREAALTAIAEGQEDQYAPIAGSEQLRQSLSEFYHRIYPDSKLQALDPSLEICITTSGTEAIYCAIMGLVDPGDEVVFFEPFFPWYAPCIRQAGGIPKPVMLPSPSFDLCLAEDAVRAAFSPRTKLCIFNSPHNPTGRVATVAELSLISSLCVEHDVLCLSDEVYEVCVYPGETHRRMCDQEGMWERTLTIGSASKLLSLTGWRIGWVYGPPDLVKAASTIHAYTTFSSPSPLQAGIVAALDAEAQGDELEPFEGRAELMHSNWLELATELRRLGVSVCPAAGGYFLVADVAATGMGDFEYCKWLANTHGVAAVPLSVFFCSEDRPNSLVRFAVCKKRETIAAAVAALGKATLESAQEASRCD